MPQFQSDPVLSIQYTSPTAGHVYGYIGLNLISVLPDESQIEVRWDVDVVYTGPGETGGSFVVDDLPVAAQLAIKSLDFSTQFTIDSEADEVTLIPANITDAAVVAAGKTYYYPSNFTVSPAQNIQIRRSTDVTNQVVTFQPGSKLTAEVLNLSATQMFNAVQEIAEFGVQGVLGTSSEVDLSLNEIQDLGNVVDDLATGIMYFDGANVIAGSQFGSLVPDNELVETLDMVLLSTYDPNGINSNPSFGWDYLTYNEVKNSKTPTETLQTRLNDIGTDISDLEAKTTHITVDNSDPVNPVTEFGSIVEVTTDNLNVPVGDVVVQGISVHEQISPVYWLDINARDATEMTVIGQTRIIGKASAFPNMGPGDITGTDLSDFDTTLGVWTAPRDMTIALSYSYHLDVPSRFPVTQHGSLSQSRARIQDGAGVSLAGGTGFVGRRFSDNSPHDGAITASQTRIFAVTAGDTVRLEIESQTDGSSNGSADVKVGNAILNLVEVR